MLDKFILMSIIVDSKICFCIDKNKKDFGMNGDILLSALADKSRLRILASLTERPKFVEELSLELNISVSTVSFHLKKLLAANLVVAKKEQYYQIFSISSQVLSEDLSRLLKTALPDKDVFKNAVKKECFKDGRVAELPVQINKRKAVYNIIADDFQKNRAYTEGEASLLIAEKCEDFMTAKKEMLEYGYIARRKGKIVKVTV